MLLSVINLSQEDSSPNPIYFGSLYEFENVMLYYPFSTNYVPFPDINAIFSFLQAILANGCSGFKFITSAVDEVF